ncbi:MAG: hypothetical protein R2757_06750 [Draconibacterium sp.]
MVELQKIKNKQELIGKTFFFLFVLLFLFALLPFIEETPLSKRWPITLVGIFLAISFYITSQIFKTRSKKFNNLLSGEKLLARWELSNDMLSNYVLFQKEERIKKNKAVMVITGILFLIISFPFLFLLNKDEISAFVLIMGGILVLVFLASLFFPWYYSQRNMNGDKQILIGTKYAYINGIFHNWDFPLSGLSKINIIKIPFYGIKLSYYYTDLTWRQSEELYIPVPDDIDLELLVNQLKSNNRK